jgi:hypothetical protein
MFSSKENIGERKTTKDGFKIIKYQAGTMLFTPAKFIWLYDKFKKESGYWMNYYRSEQDLYAEWIPNQPTFPSDWLMKIARYKKIGKVSKNTIIITGNKNGEFRNLKINQ